MAWAACGVEDDAAVGRGRDAGAVVVARGQWLGQRVGTVGAEVDAREQLLGAPRHHQVLVLAATADGQARGMRKGVGAG